MTDLDPSKRAVAKIRAEALRSEAQALRKAADACILQAEGIERNWLLDKEETNEQLSK